MEKRICAPGGHSRGTPFVSYLNGCLCGSAVADVTENVNCENRCVLATRRRHSIGRDNGLCVCLAQQLSLDLRSLSFFALLASLVVHLTVVTTTSLSIPVFFHYGRQRIMAARLPGSRSGPGDRSRPHKRQFDQVCVQQYRMEYDVFLHRQQHRR